MDKKKIGRRLAELRGDRSQEEISLALGISRSAVSAYELGERIPRDELKMAIAAYFGVSIESIFFAA